MRKSDVPVSRANRLINFGTVVLVTSSHGGRNNIVSLAWNSPISHKPMLVGVAIAKKHFSNELISKSGEYVINIPDAGLVSAVTYCGSVSGRDEDKFGKSGLTAVPGKKVAVPLIDECFAHLECKVVDKVEIGDHTLFVGEVLAASAKEGFLNSDFIPDLSQVKTLSHLGGAEFATLNKI